MRIANVHERLVLLTARGAIDVEHASEARFSAEPHAIYARWSEFQLWANDVNPSTPATSPPIGDAFGPPSPRPCQVFAVGLNYREHAVEGGYSGPTIPSIFTKFVTCLTGQNATVRVVSPRVDWEIELVAVISQGGYQIAQDEAWTHVAGLTVGQDISARDVQLAGTSPQFSLGKSFPGFGPTGPWLITPDELADRDDLMLQCALNGEVMQQARTSQMILSVPALIEYISTVCPILPGDLLFTGTPAGVGNRRDPPRYLQPGDELVSTIEGIGTLRTTFIS